MISQQEMEFKMLASQINPHFLYNTLETIRMKAFTAGDREVATAVKLLGRSMRYVLENVGASVTSLEGEIEHVDIYMMIQQLRFGDRILYEKKVEEGLELSEYQILPLLLQPVVENAFLHGLRDSDREGFIRICAAVRKGALYLTVQDNGAGMKEEELAQLNERMHHPEQSSSESIGLHNICQRIRLCYKEQGQMRIESAPEQGTLVTLILPDMSGEEGKTQ